MIRRFISTGRLIPLEVMKEIGNLPKTNYNKLKDKVNGYFEIDNNQPKGERQTLLEDSREFLKPIPIDYKLGEKELYARKLVESPRGQKLVDDLYQMRLRQGK